MGEVAVATYTYAAYLALEKEGQTKYEFHNGIITPMAGGTPVHALLSMNIGFSLNNQLREKNNFCAVYSSDLKIRVETTNRTYYPDVSVVYEKPVTSTKDANAVINPTLVVEVLSDSTAGFDRGAKFAHYREIPSLQQYVVVSQTEAMVDTFCRVNENTWEILTITGLEAEVKLRALDISLNMVDIYRQVEFEQASES